MAENQINSAYVPAISVILATRGSNIGFLRNCIESLKNQTFKNFEIIVVTKKPKQLQDLLDFEQIRFLEEKGSTLGAARNLGVRNARGDLVSFIDDDAEAPAEWLDKISATFSRFPSLCCLGGPHFTPQGESKEQPMNFVHGLFAEAHLQKTYLDKYAIGKIAGCNVTYKKSAFQEAGCLNENLGTCEDWEFNRRLVGRRCNLRFDPEIWVFHHRQGLRHVFKSFSKSAPFFLSWETLKLSRTDFFIASVYAANSLFILLLVILFINPYYSVLLFLSFLVGYVVFTAVRTKTYDRRIFYFPLAILFTGARVLGFYFGLFKYAALKISTLFVRSNPAVEHYSTA